MVNKKQKHTMRNLLSNLKFLATLVVIYSIHFLILKIFSP